MFSSGVKNKLWPNHSTFLHALSWMLLFSISSYSLAQMSLPSRQNLTKEKGQLRAFSFTNRSAVIGNRTFQLAEDLIVKDKSGTVMMPHQYRSLSFADLVEYTRLNGSIVIKEIRIMRYAS